MREVDVPARLAETIVAIQALADAGCAIPFEALELREIMERCVVAERLAATNLESPLAIGREAYEAYANHTKWKSLATGADLPKWDALSQPIRDAWIVSAAWVAGRVLRKFGVVS